MSLNQLPRRKASAGSGAMSRTASPTNARSLCRTVSLRSTAQRESQIECGSAETVYGEICFQAYLDDLTWTSPALAAPAI